MTFRDTVLTRTESESLKRKRGGKWPTGENQLTHHLQCRINCKIQFACQVVPKWLTGSGKGSIPKYMLILVRTM